MMEKINDVVEWDNIEAVLNEHYEAGRSKEGADAFPPLLLMKCLLLQKWFCIPLRP
jgi:transposase, IS5 family